MLTLRNAGNVTANLARSYSRTQDSDNVTAFPVQRRTSRAQGVNPATRADKLVALAALAFVAGVLAVFTVIALCGAGEPVRIGDSLLYGP